MSYNIDEMTDRPLADEEANEISIQSEKSRYVEFLRQKLTHAIPVLDQKGQPVLDENGKPVKRPLEPGEGVEIGGTFTSEKSAVNFNNSYTAEAVDLIGWTTPPSPKGGSRARTRAKARVREGKIYLWIVRIKYPNVEEQPIASLNGKHKEKAKDLAA